MFMYFMGQYWHWIVIALLLSTTTIQHYKITTLKAEAKSQAILLEVSQGAVKDLQGAIKKQNAAVEKLKTDSDAHVAKAQKEVVKANEARKQSEKTAAELMAMKKPKDTPACTAADALINGELK